MRQKVYLLVMHTTAYTEQHLIPRVKYGGGSFMLWGCLAFSGPWTPVQIRRIMNSTRYQEILDQTLCGSARSCGWNMAPNIIKIHTEMVSGAQSQSSATPLKTCVVYWGVQVYKFRILRNRECSAWSSPRSLNLVEHYRKCCQWRLHLIIGRSV